MFVRGKIRTANQRDLNQWNRLFVDACDKAYISTSLSSQTGYFQVQAFEIFGA
jgi:hypothetical protein